MRWIAITVGVMMTVTAMGQWNSPHATTDNANTRYSSFAGPPKTLDPAKAYSSNELQFIAQIYEPLLQYHYLKRPYTLEPLVATHMPTVSYFNAHWQPLPKDAKPVDIAYAVYDIHIRPGIEFEPHPAFSRQANGAFRYHDLSPSALSKVDDLMSFDEFDTRELTADDYAYEIKRLAAPWVHSPIYGLMSEHILGLSAYAKTLQVAYNKAKAEDQWVDLRQYPLAGVKVISRYHLQITLNGAYPQFNYWLAMPFFAPIAWEVDAFYSQPGLQAKNINWDWYPVGTGPYQLIENNPNSRMVLQKNPVFRGESYPSEGEASDVEHGYLADAGQTMPFVDRFEFHLEKESIPRWSKFLQGYYDHSGVSADSFDQAIQLDEDSNPVLTPRMQQQDLSLKTTVSPSVYYMGFNMMDDLVGGDSERARYLRQAISIAIDYEEYIAIFMNGRGVAANGPIPPGIFGYTDKKTGMNDVVYLWDGDQAKRKPLEVAKGLLAKAGYPNGINPRTNKPLVIHYDVASSGSPDDKARMNWMRKQFKKIGLELNIRSTQYNRFREKVRTGNAQLFSWGWLADYPDPENFLFLLYGPNGKVMHGGENAANYNNPQYDALFEQIVHLPDSPQRQQKINELLAIVQQDSPWIWGVHPIDFTLSHAWNRPAKPNAMANNALKYAKLNVTQRQYMRHVWNEPIFWPIVVVVIFLLILVMPLAVGYWLRENKPVIQRDKDRE